MSQPVLGKDCVLAHFDIADWATPALTPIDNAVNVSMPGVSKNSVSLPSRGSQGWDLKGSGLKALDLQIEYLYHTADTFLATLRDSFINDTVLGFAVLTGPVDGVFPAGIDAYDVEGWKFPGIVFEMPSDEELEEGKSFDFKIEAARKKDGSGNLLLPTWVTIAGSNAP